MSAQRTDDVTARRYRGAGYALLASVAARALAMIATIVAFRVGLPHLGEERFGAWMMVTSLAMLLTLCDLGVAAGSIGAVAEANARHGPHAVRTIAADTIVLLACMGLAAGLLIAALVHVVPLEMFMRNATDVTRGETRRCVLVLAMLLAVVLPAQGAMRLFEGVQLGWIAHGLAALCSLASIGVVLCLPARDADTPTYLLATFGMQQLPGLLLAIGAVAKSKGRPWPIRSPRAIIAHTDLLARGRLFVPLQISGVVGYAAGGLVVAARLGPAHVADLALVQRIFSLVSQPLQLVHASLWPAYADAHARGDTHFIRKAFGGSLTVTLVAALVGVTTIQLYFPQFVHFFSAGHLAPPMALVIAYATWVVIESVGYAVAMLLNGRDLLRPQIAMACAFVPLSVIVMTVAIGPFGVAGVPIALLLAHLLSTELPLLTVLRRRCLPAATEPALRVAEPERTP